MRFDTPVFFQKVTQGEYDKKTGNYADDTIVEKRKFASVNNLGIKTQKILYGQIKEGSMIIRLQNEYTEPFDYIRIGKKRYKVDFARPFDVKESFSVSEVQ